MLWKRWAIAALALLAVGVGTGAGRAGDTIRLALNTSAPTVTLDLRPDNDADVVDARYRGFYGGSSYYPRYGGYSYYPRYGGYGGYSYYPRSYGYSYYPRYYSSYYGGYGGYSYYPRSYGYSSYYYGPSYYQPSYYYQPPVYYYNYYSPYYCPISLKTDPYPSATVPGSSYQPVLPKMDPLPNQPNGSGQPTPPNQTGDGTFPYDGGPSSPVPMPRTDPQPQNAPNKGFTPGEGRLISLPVATAAPKYSYPAYGEKR